jgi:hypothetical protein
MMTDTLKEYHFTDAQIEFVVRLLRYNSAQRKNDSVEDLLSDLANQIEDQIVNHRTND